MLSPCFIYIKKSRVKNSLAKNQKKMKKIMKGKEKQ